MDALGGGRLRITEDCVFLQREGDDVLVVWPADRTIWKPGSRTITFEDADAGTVTLADGDQVVTGGGNGGTHLRDSSAEEWAADFKWVSPPAEECLTDVWWILGGIRKGSLDQEPFEDASSSGSQARRAATSNA
jgi:hypothetical protein